MLFVGAAREAESLALRLAHDVEVEWALDARDAGDTAARCADLDLVIVDVSGAPMTARAVTTASAAVTGGERLIADLGQRIAHVPLLVLVCGRAQGAAALALGAHGFVVKERLDRDTLMDAACMAAALHGLRRELHQANERLIHADRLASLGQITAGVAHEIANPAASLLANLSALKDQLGAACDAEPDRDTAAALDEVAALVPEWADILDDSIAGIGHIRSIVKDLRNFSRLDSQDAEVTDVVEAVESACKLTEGLIRRRARLIKELGPVPTVRGDHGKLVQVFTNLLANAAQAIGGGLAEHRIRVSTKEREGMVVVAVEDTGCGIPEAARARVFEPYFTTKPRDVGTGLGLALSARIVHRYGGDIGFAPLPAGGTRFEVRLHPDGRPAPRLPDAQRSRRDRRRPAPRARVLLVDDEPGLLRAFRRVLAPLHEVVMAASGQQALDILERDTGFDGVICDFSLPDVDGSRIYEAVARRDRELAARIVFCTGGPVSHRGRVFIESTTNTVLEKPVPPELLLGAIEQLGKR